MKTINITIDKLKLNKMAETVFLDISGLGREGKKYERMRESAFSIRELVQEKLKLMIDCRFYSDMILEVDKLTVQDVEITCGTFRQLDQDMLEGVYLYVVSAGDVSMPEAKAIEQLYADFWGNAYTDALRDLLKDELEHTSIISDSFGPGFYGMDTSELVKLGQLLDFEEKGITVKNGQMMVPQKSCTGIIFKVNDNYKKIDDACERCQGNHLNCSMCIVNRSR